MGRRWYETKRFWWAWYAFCVGVVAGIWLTYVLILITKGHA